MSLGRPGLSPEKLYPSQGHRAQSQQGSGPQGEGLLIRAAGAGASGFLDSALGAAWYVPAPRACQRERQGSQLDRTTWQVVRYPLGHPAPTPCLSLWQALGRDTIFQRAAVFWSRGSGALCCRVQELCIPGFEGCTFESLLFGSLNGTWGQSAPLPPPGPVQLRVISTLSC